MFIVKVILQRIKRSLNFNFFKQKLNNAWVKTCNFKRYTQFIYLTIKRFLFYNFFAADIKIKLGLFVKISNSTNTTKIWLLQEMRTWLIAA